MHTGKDALSDSASGFDFRFFNRFFSEADCVNSDRKWRGNKIMKLVLTLKAFRGGGVFCFNSG